MSIRAEEITVVQPKKVNHRPTTNLSSPPPRRAPTVRRKRKTVRDLSHIEAPLPPNVSKVIDGSIVDNTASSIKRVGDNKNRSAFLITFVPNSSVREDVNPKLYSALKDEIQEFARYVLDPSNMKFVLKPTADNKDKNWFSKIKEFGSDRVASIEDSKTSNKRLHTHIFLPVYHSTKLQVDLDNLRKIAAIMLEPLGIKSPRIDVKVERNQLRSARDYVLKGNSDEADRKLII